ncbi:MAG: UDP-N-acetylmuramoyl-tripeptide--D-alanyl-D-alanine ligase [Clostridia bacterium]|nr:UDP-N-acetylmuramoyl-tripeptide--D-alanyl-D-alanine ligase [Clostridia bacterium]
MKVNVGCNGLTMTELAQICGGMLCCVGGEVNRDMPFRYVCTDSREAEAGSLFVALGGERVDGHDYIGAAVSSGNECVLCERIPDISDKKYVAVVVDDSLKAIGELAKAYDRRLHHRKVAITGSVGKTTTKEFVAAVLAEGFRVHKTEGNYNSTLGMPLSLLSLRNDTEVSVLEMGMSNFGEIEYMSRIAEPDIAIVTNIGSSHMEYLGSRENICHAKMEIVKGLKQGGTLLLNGDEPMLRAYLTPGVRPIFVGIQSDCDFRAVNIREGIGRTVFDVCYGGKTVHNVVIPTMGRHNVYAALFAYAVGVRMNLDDQCIIDGLNHYRPVGMRQNIYNIGDITVIEDCYNASPESMRAAINVLESLSGQMRAGRMAAVLGDMYELGENGDRFHEDIGLYFAARGGSMLYTFGQAAEQIAVGAILGGIDPENIYRNGDTKNPWLSGEMLLHSLRAGDTLLVKASRGAAAERILNYLKENADRLRK